MYAVAERLDPDTYLALARAVYAEMALAGDHRGRRVPLPAPRAGRAAVRRPERDGRRAGRGGRARPASGSPCSTPATSPAGSTPTGTAPLDAGAAALQRRERRRLGRAAGRLSAEPRPQRPDRRRRPLGARRARRRDLGAGRGRAEPTAARCTSTSASSRPRTPLCWPPTAAPRPSCWTARACSARGPPPCTPPTSPTTTSRCWAARHHRLLLPDHRARPGRRHRAGPSAARRRHPAQPGLRPARGDRPVRGGPRAGDARAAGQPPARPVHPGELLAAAIAAGYRSLGWPDGGRIAAGAPADLVAVRSDSVRTAGRRPGQQIVYAATARRRRPRRGRRRDGRRDGRHRLGTSGRSLARRVWRRLVKPPMTQHAGHRHRRAGHLRRRPGAGRAGAARTTPPWWSRTA